jgi:hypothetical protein
MEDAITLLKNFTYVGDAGQSWATDWVYFPAEHKQAQGPLVLAVSPRMHACGPGLTAPRLAPRIPPSGTPQHSGAASQRRR